MKYLYMYGIWFNYTPVKCYWLSLLKWYIITTQHNQCKIILALPSYKKWLITTHEHGMINKLTLVTIWNPTIRWFCQSCKNHKLIIVIVLSNNIGNENNCIIWVFNNTRKDYWDPYNFAKSEFSSSKFLSTYNKDCPYLDGLTKEFQTPYHNKNTGHVNQFLQTVHTPEK